MHEESDITTIAAHMVAAGLPDPFVLHILALARESEGIEDLVHLWARAVEAGDATERSAIEDDLRAAIKDREPRHRRGVPAC